MSDTLVKAIRVGVRNSPKVSLCANPGHFLKVATSAQTSALLEAGHSPLISLSPGLPGQDRSAIGSGVCGGTGHWGNRQKPMTGGVECSFALAPTI
jgi:hypothetical protein